MIFTISRWERQFQSRFASPLKFGIFKATFFCRKFFPLVVDVVAVDVVVEDVFTIRVALTYFIENAL